jgi:hypothetical protein
MLPHGMMEPRPTPKNGRDGASLDMEICSFWKAARLMRLRAAPPSIRTCYSLTLAMVGEVTTGSMLDGWRPCCGWPPNHQVVASIFFPFDFC